MVGEPTRRRLVEAATARLGPGLEGRWIVEHALDLDGPSPDRSPPARGLDEPVAPGVSSRVESMVSRRQAGEPLQYILGRWPFRTIELAVDRRVLIPRPETEVVVDVALAELRRATSEWSGAPSSGRSPVAVDLGTGSGAIALSLAVEGGSGDAGPDVWATDSSVEALEVARANLRALQALQALPTPTAARARQAPTAARAARAEGEPIPPDRAPLDRAPLDRVRLVHGDWFAALPKGLMGVLDLIVSNPPYVSAEEYPELDPVVRHWEPEGALVAGAATDGSSGLAEVEAIIAGAPRWLRSGGALVIEMAPHQADVASSMARRAGLAHVRVEPDLAGRPRALVATGQ
ncbi:MAG TPA: HemK/PrmC family methyltransferase [Acidimicrobiales bacterium]